jgi:hypothetical protein
MKAKEWAEQLNKVDDKDKQAILAFINLIVKDFIADLKRLITERHCQSNSAVGAIIRELDDKWRSVCRQDKHQTPILNPEGFVQFLKKKGMFVAEPLPRIQTQQDASLNTLIGLALLAAGFRGRG